MNKDKTTLLFTTAYNAEKTLQRAVDSILNQSNKSFRYYLLDNGSFDGTKQKVAYYSERDNRVTPLFRATNQRNTILLKEMFLKEAHTASYFATLDADDEYTLDFLEKMLVFMHEYELDIAACGSYFVDANTNEIIGKRMLERNLIIEGNGFDESLPQYHQFMRTIWGKVYSLSVLRKCTFKNIESISYGADTLFAMEAFRNANRIGILAEPLHKYYISPMAVSYQFDNRRIASNRLLLDVARDFLISKSGDVSDKNHSFLYLVYLSAIRDTLNVLLNAKISVYDKLDNLLDIFQSKHTQELIKWPGAESQKKQLFIQVSSWMLSQREVRNGKGFDIAADILAAMNIYPSQIDKWQDGWVFLLLAKIRASQAKMSNATIGDLHIVSIAANSPYLAELDAAFLCYFQDIVFSVLQGDEKKALDYIIKLINQDTDIPDEYIDDFLKLALNLSAKLEKSDYFIYFKKLQISVLIGLSRIEEAKKEFADWDEILPYDLDFKELKKRLEI